MKRDFVVCVSTFEYILLPDRPLPFSFFSTRITYIYTVGMVVVAVACRAAVASSQQTRIDHHPALLGSIFGLLVLLVLGALPAVQ